jgi:hypothetical protein
VVCEYQTEKLSAMRKDRLKRRLFEAALKMDTIHKNGHNHKSGLNPHREVSNDIQRYFAKARRMPETMRN